MSRKGNSNRVEPIQASTVEPESALVLELLRGAARGDRDPDIELAIILARLDGATDDEIRSALASLVVDADLD
jgi:hypothetical protein